jgi:hypothetical protein
MFYITSVSVLLNFLSNGRKKEEETRPAWAGFKTAEEGRTKIM